MLFNSYEFVLFFLPSLIGLFYLTSRFGIRLGIWLLVVGSLFFYGYSEPSYLILLFSSAVFNFFVGNSLSHKVSHKIPGKIAMLVIGVGANLALLAYFKYRIFFLENISVISGTVFTPESLTIPLAISFFTFQQIAFLVDCSQARTKESDFVSYLLFVSFFPQLIAGPIVHHKQVSHQFRTLRTTLFSGHNLFIGLTVFFVGLLKKLVIADGIADFSNPVFNAAAQGETLSFIEAWIGALAYTFQIYYDFSAYSDMAIGLARIFNIVLPINFNSPYKSRCIIEFWHRWHITLSYFFRDYLYIPLGGNQGKIISRCRNLMVTMLLAGLWHGAGWTFVMWGGLHGLYLMVNHGWRYLVHRKSDQVTCRPIRTVGWGVVTFLSVVVAWVFFRADHFGASVGMLKGMVGGNGVILPEVYQYKFGELGHWLMGLGVEFGPTPHYYGVRSLAWVVLVGAATFILPNTLQIFRRLLPLFLEDEKHIAVTPSWLRWFEWKLTPMWGYAFGIVVAICLAGMTVVNEFIYFKF